MDFMAPPMFDILNFQTWKVNMSMYFKALGIHVYLATIKDSYFFNGKYLEANTKAIHTLKSTLNDEYLSRVSNIDSTSVVWTLSSLSGNKRKLKRGMTRMMEVLLSTCATWSKG